MSLPGRRTGWALIFASLSLSAQPLSAQRGAAPTPVKAEEHKAPARVSGTRMTDAQAAQLAQESLGGQDPASIKATLARLKGHTFKSSKVPEREIVLYAQGLLEYRIGNLSAASVPLKNLERQWPKSPFLGEAQSMLAEEAVAKKRYKEAEGRLHKALASDMPSERKRKPQELLVWTLVEQGRPQEALPIVQALRPLAGNEKPSEKGLAAIVETLGAAGERDQTQANRKDFQNLYPKSELIPRVELAWGRLLGRSGEAQEAAQVLRNLIKDYPRTAQADDARLALASLLTDGSIPDTKGLPSPESLLDEVRRGSKGLPKGAAQVVELRLLVGKSLWEDALNLVDRLEPSLREGQPEVKKLWSVAWNAWVDQRLEKGFPGELITRLKPGAFAALDAKSRTGVAELLAANGLLELLPGLINEAPTTERPGLRKAGLARVQPEAQPQAVLRMLPTKGGTPDELLLKARAEAALEQWGSLRKSLESARPGVERIKLVVTLLQRPMTSKETTPLRLAEAEGWLTRVREKGETREPLNILVADFRFQNGDLRGALALYPVKATAPEQRGWVALMRAQAYMRLGQPDQARALIKAARDEQGFKGQREAIAKSLGAY